MGSIYALLPAEPESLSHPDGDAPDLLHVTVRYLGDSTDGHEDWLDAHIARLADGRPPVEAAVIGCGTLGQDGAVVLILESETIVELRDEIDAALADDPEAPVPPDPYPLFIPHISLGYPDDPAGMIEHGLGFVGETIRFDRLGRMNDDQIIAVDLTGTAQTNGGSMAATDTPTIELTLSQPDGSTTMFGEVYDDDVAAVEQLVVDATVTVDAGSVVAFNGLDETFTAAGIQVDWHDDVSALVDENGDPPSGEFPVGVRPVEQQTDAAAAEAAVDVPTFTIALTAADGSVVQLPVTSGSVNFTSAAEAASTFAVQFAGGQTAPATWEGVLVVEGFESGDRRIIDDGALSWRDLPLPLMLMTRNPDSGAAGHAGAEMAGRIDWVERRENGEVWGGGILDVGSVAGAEAQRLMTPDASGKVMLRGVSVDLDEIDAIVEGDEMNGRLRVTAGRVMGATLTPFPAFQEARVSLVDAGQDDEALVAAAGHARTGAEARTWIPYPWTPDTLVASAGGPVAPPSAWFLKSAEDAAVDAPFPFRVEADGRCHGWAAAWGAQHIGYTRRVTVPKSRSGYAYFANKQTITAEGTTVSTGPIIMDTVHPNLRLKASDAQAFYAHTGCAVADVAVIEDEFGIYLCGALRPDVTPAQARALRGSDVSPDWRPMPGGLEVVAMLAVNTSGFITPALVAAAGGEDADYVQPGRVAAFYGGDGGMALVAAGMLRHESPVALRTEIDGLTAELEAMRSAVAPLLADRDRAVAARAAAAVARLDAPRRKALRARVETARRRLNIDVDA